MKRSKVLAGVAALMLAGIGAFATSLKVTANTYWYKPTIVSPCVSTVVAFNCVESVVGGCLGPIGEPSEGIQLFVTDDCDRLLRPE